ncbi:hypothetical protein UlMin_016304 [Ulmus minor]
MRLFSREREFGIDLLYMLPTIFFSLYCLCFFLCTGMPYPQNLETAKEVEAVVMENRAVAATIAILAAYKMYSIVCPDFLIILNNFSRLSLEQLERLAKLGTRAQKTAGRDIAHIVSTRGNGATTVSATMFFASMVIARYYNKTALQVDILVFVTGGSGGVHKHGKHTIDVSFDLTELGRTPIAVISVGVKSILDIPQTLEYLETQGVCAAAYRTNEFLVFFTETSGCKIHLSVWLIKCSRCFKSELQTSNPPFPIFSDLPPTPSAPPPPPPPSSSVFAVVQGKLTENIQKSRVNSLTYFNLLNFCVNLVHTHLSLCLELYESVVDSLKYFNPLNVSIKVVS